ncbi:MAG: AAA family ATPase [Acidobacteriota bacterium]|nr:AAA family ATPase [Acidobacteriota bacterium]
MTEATRLLPLDEAVASTVRRLEDNVQTVVRGKPEAVRLAIVAILARGHVLIEDVPGVGKTTLAQALARSIGLDFQRIQFTSDLLPSDIIGVSIYSQEAGCFEFSPGPLFANVLLADEINRATPKTQSALLEAMSERRVSVDRERLDLPEPFVVLATQNPLEFQGTFPLPESQLDRFLMSLELGYPPKKDERELLMTGGVENVLERLQPVVVRDELVALLRHVAEVSVADKLTDYILAIAEETRENEEFSLGVSTRAAQDLYRATQAMAVCEGRDFAIPDDVQAVALQVLSHRVLLRSGGGIKAARSAVQGVLARVPIPL